MRRPVDSTQVETITKLLYLTLFRMWKEINARSWWEILRKEIT